MQSCCDEIVFLRLEKMIDELVCDTIVELVNGMDPVVRMHCNLVTIRYNMLKREKMD